MAEGLLLPSGLARLHLPPSRPGTHSSPVRYQDLLSNQVRLPWPELVCLSLASLLCLMSTLDIAHTMLYTFFSFHALLSNQACLNLSESSSSKCPLSSFSNLPSAQLVSHKRSFYFSIQLNIKPVLVVVVVALLLGLTVCDQDAKIYVFKPFATHLPFSLFPFSYPLINQYI